MTTGWETRKLGQLIERIETRDPSREPERVFEYVDVSAVSNKSHMIENSEAVLGANAPSRARRVIRTGDVIFATIRPTLSRTAIVPSSLDEQICSTGYFVARPRQTASLDSRFLFYFLLSADVQTRMETLQRGASYPAVSDADMREQLVPLPPLEEQKRIVAILDAAFADIDKVTQTLGECELKARQVFASWLHQTFNQETAGRVPHAVPGQRPETDALSASIEPEVASNARRTRTGGRDATTRAIAGELSLSVGHTRMPTREGWKWSDLSELATLESGHTPSRRNPEYWAGDIPWIGIQDAKRAHGGWISDTTQKVTPAGVANSSTRVLPARTVCLSRTASVGYVVIMGQDMATSQDFANWVCGPDLEPEFLQFALLAEGRNLLKFASGAVHQTIYYPELKALRICHPSVERQRALVSELKQVRAESEDLHRSFESKLGLAVDLRQSLLHQAFSGQL